MSSVHSRKRDHPWQLGTQGEVKAEQLKARLTTHSRSFPSFLQPHTRSWFSGGEFPEVLKRRRTRIKWGQGGGGIRVGGGTCCLDWLGCNEIYGCWCFCDYQRGYE